MKKTTCLAHKDGNDKRIKRKCDLSQTALSEQFSRKRLSFLVW